MEKAVRYSGNSAPGPDGIPFKAWRAFGPLGVSILHGVAQTLERPQGAEELHAAYFDEPDTHSHHYNERILCYIVKIGR